MRPLDFLSSIKLKLGVVIVAAGLLFMSALKFLPLADTTALNYTVLGVVVMACHSLT